jgi:uncharacterized protein
LKIDLSDIAGTPGARGRYSVSECLAPTEEFSYLGPVTGQIVVENTGFLLLVRGQLRATLRLSCVRCLTEFERPLVINMVEEFATQDTAPDVATIDRDEPEASAMSSFVLDVSELVRQQVAVNVPMASVCQPDCRGICPKCGRSLNEGPCGCRVEPTDGRWAKLADLLAPRPGEEES